MSGEQKPATGPLSAYRVLDLTHVLAGPFATYQLAVLGAEVIKIEPPQKPDMMRHEGPHETLAEQGMGIHFQSQSAGKKAVTLDLLTEKGKELFHRLVKTADVLVANYRLESQQRLGVDAASLKKINPNLIRCSITGYGQTGPKACHAAYDNVIQAFSGLMAATGTAEEACKVGPPVLDYGTGAQAALAITAALLQREKSGVVAELDVAMLDAAMMLMSSSVTETLLQGNAPKRVGNSNPVKAGYGCYDTSSGQLMVGAFTVRQHCNLWLALDKKDIAEIIATLSPLQLEQRYATDRAALSEIFKQRDADFWEDLLNTKGVPAARVRELDESLKEPQVASRSLLGKPVSESTEASLATQFPVNAWRSDSMNSTLLSYPPQLSEHNSQIYSDLGVCEIELAELEKAGVI